MRPQNIELLEWEFYVPSYIHKVIISYVQLWPLGVGRAKEENPKKLNRTYLAIKQLVLFFLSLIGNIC